MEKNYVVSYGELQKYIRDLSDIYDGVFNNYCTKIPSQILGRVLYTTQGSIYDRKQCVTAWQSGFAMHYLKY